MRCLPPKQDERIKNHDVSKFNAKNTTSDSVDDVLNLSFERTSKVPMVLDVKYEPVRNNVVLRIKPSHSRPDIDSSVKHNRPKRYRKRRKRLRKNKDALGKQCLFLSINSIDQFVYTINTYIKPRHLNSLSLTKVFVIN